jgi:dolichyl-diphosphooligosaccharide---protein glycosyltransferase
MLKQCELPFLQYLYWNGAQRFFTWFDFTVWYPLGRPVGTTIYPGMQFTAVWLKNHVVGDRMTLNDVCCYIPAWFGVLATLITAAIAYECAAPVNASHNLYTYLVERHRGGNTAVTYGTPTTTTTSSSKTLLGLHSPAVECAVLAAFMMAIVPAHLMRSMGGGYDNESVAVTAMVLTFYCWTQALRATHAVPTTVVWGLATGLAYFYMVAAWGGYVFVLNLIGVHAAVLVGLGRFSPKIYAAYSVFYLVGTSLAVQVPVVGWAPLKSLEQLGPCAVFLGYQVLLPLELYIAHLRRTDIKRKKPFGWWQAWQLRLQVGVLALLVAIVAAMIVMPAGYFGPISSRVRGLFVQHTKTGNPLVDSVAEHQPASSRAYFQYLHHVCSLAPVGYLLVGLLHISDASSFLLVWGTAAYFFSHKMVRLILLTAPIACILGGMAAGRVLAWCVAQWWDSETTTTSSSGAAASAVASSDATSEWDDDKNGVTGARGGPKGDKKKKKPVKKAPSYYSSSKSSFEGLEALQNAVETFGKTKTGITAKRTLSLILILTGFLVGQTFVAYCWRLSYDLSNPTIIQKARKHDGEIINVDDYREAYWWLRDNTPEDSRVMAWWDCTFEALFFCIFGLAIVTS